VTGHVARFFSIIDGEARYRLTEAGRQMKAAVDANRKEGANQAT
jgi:hypothetical protein